MIFNNLASKTVIHFEFANRRRTAYLPPFVAKQKHTTMKIKRNLKHIIIAKINAMLVKYNLPFKATDVYETVYNGSCGYDALRQAFASVPDHPFAGLTIDELRYVLAKLFGSDEAAQDDFAVLDPQFNVDERRRQILENDGEGGWLDFIDIDLFATALKTNIIVVHFNG